jgi:hypothetical protein
VSGRRERFLDQAREKREKRDKSGHGDYQLRSMTQGQAPMETLTTSPEWEIFRQVVQGEIDRLEVALDQIAPAFLNPDTVSYEQILTLKFNAVAAGARVDALREVLGMPQQIIQDGEKARDILRERLEQKAAASDS